MIIFNVTDFINHFIDCVKCKLLFNFYLLYCRFFFFFFYYTYINSIGSLTYMLGTYLRVTVQNDYKL